ACLDALGDTTYLDHHYSMAEGGDRLIRYGDRTLDFTPPWPRQKYADLFREHVGIALNAPDAELADAAQAHKLEITGKHRDVIAHELFEHVVEPMLEKSDRPMFVYDYPAALCPLTKRQRGNPAVAERFE